MAVEIWVKVRNVRDFGGEMEAAMEDFGADEIDEGERENW